VLARPARIWQDAVLAALETDPADSARRAHELVSEGWTRFSLSDPAIVRACIRSLPDHDWQNDVWLLTGLASSYQNAPDALERSSATLYFTEARRVQSRELRAGESLEQRLSSRLHLVAHQRSRGRFAEALTDLVELGEAVENATLTSFEWRIDMEARIRLERSLIDWHRAEFDGGESYIGPALALAESRLLPHEQIDAYGVAALYALVAENYERVETWAERAIAVAAAEAVGDDPSEVPLSSSPAIASSMFALGMIALDRGDFERAGLFSPFLEELARGNEWRAYAALFSARRLALRRQPGEALEALRLTRQLTHRWTDAVYLGTLSLIVRRSVETALGRPQAVESSAALTEDSRHIFCRGQHDGWLYLSEGRYQDAIAGVAECIRLGDRHARGPLIEVLLIDAIARWAAGEQVEAASGFDYALALSAESGFRRAFFEMPAYAGSAMIAEASARPQPAAVVELLGQLAETFVPEGASAPRLSEREYEILLGLQHGRSLRELSQQLFISHNTTKTHVRNIYRKLGVRSRGEALITARHLGITLESPAN
jgi:DNA-binding CsgD family transcriptional regulator